MAQVIIDTSQIQQFVTAMQITLSSATGQTKTDFNTALRSILGVASLGDAQSGTGTALMTASLTKSAIDSQLSTERANLTDALADLVVLDNKVNNLNSALVLSGTWNAGSGTFPGGGSAAKGSVYIVSGAGTVNGVTFSVNDRIVALANNASTTTFSGNWFKEAYNDLVLSVGGKTGIVSLDARDVTTIGVNSTVVAGGTSTYVLTVKITQANYNAIVTPVPGVLYIIEG